MQGAQRSFGPKRDPHRIALNALIGMLGAVLLSRGTTDASIIASHMGLSSSSNNTGPRAFGQSFTTPAGSVWNSITANFYSNSSSTAPEAIGNLYLLTQAYTGTPAGLSASTPGFVAEATTITGEEHVFTSSVDLFGSKQYFIYEDSLTPTGGVYADYTGSGGQTLYYTDSNSTSFGATSGLEMNFLVQGAVPEPATASLVAIASLVGLLRRRRRFASR